MPDRRCIFFITSHTFHHKPKAAGYVSTSFSWLCNSRRCSEYYDGFYFEKPSMGDAVFRVSWQILSQTTMREKDWRLANQNNPVERSLKCVRVHSVYVIDYSVSAECVRVVKLPSGGAPRLHTPVSHRFVCRPGASFFVLRIHPQPGSPFKHATRLSFELRRYLKVCAQTWRKFACVFRAGLGEALDSCRGSTVLPP